MNVWRRSWKRNDPRLTAKRTGTLIDEFPADKQKEFADLARMLSLWMLFFDAPEHTRLGKLMNKGFFSASANRVTPDSQGELLSACAVS